MAYAPVLVFMVVVLAASAAVGYRTLDLEITAALELSVPRGSSATGKRDGILVYFV